ncbi:MAG: hypothetical protein IPH40_00905 [Polaromonas sp.]|nr:hypothetical protein [Polaromonas sp.]
MTYAPVTRAQFGLPEKAFVFADFNQSFKIQPEIFAAWVRILKAVPNSVLWLASGHAIYLKNIRAEWVKAGLDSERLIIAPRVSVEQYLAQYQLVDLFLDVFHIPVALPPATHYGRAVRYCHLWVKQWFHVCLAVWYGRPGCQSC